MSPISAPNAFSKSDFYDPGGLYAVGVFYMKESFAAGGPSEAILAS